MIIVVTNKVDRMEIIKISLGNIIILSIKKLWQYLPKLFEYKRLNNELWSFIKFD